MADNDVPVQKRRITDNDWADIGAYIADEAHKRKGRRRHLEKQWKEVDRQLRMDPLPRIDSRGRPIPGTQWMSSLELPLQAEALELLNADARRLLFADDRDFFSVHSSLNDEKLELIEDDADIIPGLSDVNKAALDAVNPGQKSMVDQDDVDAIVEGVIQHHHALYDLRGAWDVLNAEAFKYGTFCGRVRMVSHDKFSNDFRGVQRKNMTFPALLPQSVKNTYLDDTFTATMHEGIMVAPSHIYEYWHNVDDLKLAAAKGSRDATKPNGGWMPDKLKGLESTHDDGKSVRVLEYEGDLIVPRNRGASMFLPNVIVTCVMGAKDSKALSRVVRYRESAYPFRSYISHPYHLEDADSPYGVSPLMKGAPIQAAASEAFNSMMNSAKLNVERPVTYNPSDHYLEAQGGPLLEPMAQWPAISEPKLVDVGSPEPLTNIYLALLGQYADVTGISAPRLGAQTKSHQTAFAVDTEITRGVVRTVDYVRSVFYGPMRTFLSMEYEMIRSEFVRQEVWVPKQHAYMSISKEMLPDTVTFDVHGAGGPLEEREKQQMQNNALMQAMQVEQMRRQMGEQGMDLGQLQKEIFERAGLSTDKVLVSASPAVPPGTPEQPAVPANDGGVEGAPTDPLIQLAALTGQ